MQRGCSFLILLVVVFVVVLVVVLISFPSCNLYLHLIASLQNYYSKLILLNRNLSLRLSGSSVEAPLVEKKSQHLCPRLLRFLLLL